MKKVAKLEDVLDKYDAVVIGYDEDGEPIIKFNSYEGFERFRKDFENGEVE